jgi:hypothetical protein
MERTLEAFFHILLKMPGARLLLFSQLLWLVFPCGNACSQSSEDVADIQLLADGLMDDWSISALFNIKVPCTESLISVFVHNDLETENISTHLYCQITASVVGQINALLNLSAIPEISLYLANKKFFDMTLNTAPWIQATTINGNMFLRYDSSLSDESRRTIKHETVHAYIYALAGPKVPAWMEEGLAQMIAGEVADKPSQTYHNRPSLRALRKEFSLEDKDLLAEQYLISANAVRLLVKDFGFTGIGDYLKKISYGYSHERAFSAIFRITEADLEKKLL